MAQAGKRLPDKSMILWDNQFVIPTDQDVGIVEFDETNKTYAGAALSNAASRWPDELHTDQLFRPLNTINQERREALQFLGRQILQLMPLIIDGEIDASGDSDFHLTVDRVASHYTIHLEVPEIIGEKGDKGDTGDTGMTGEKGDKGDKGDTGDTGATGSTGAAGADGADGADGMDGADCTECGDTENPPPPDTDPNPSFCGIAAYLTTWFDAEWRSVMDIAAVEADAASAAAQALNYLSLNPVAIASNILIDWITNAYDVGIAAIEAEVSPDVLEHFECLLYCILKANNGFQDNTIEEWGTEINATAGETNGGGFAAGAFVNGLNTYKLTTWRRRALIGSLEPSDACAELCEDCADVGTCTLSNWDVYPSGSDDYGFITSRDEGTGIISCSSADHAVGGNYYLIIQTASDSTCCNFADINFVGESSHLVLGLECNATFPVTSLHVGLCVHLFQIQSGSPFTVDLTLNECAP